MCKGRFLLVLLLAAPVLLDLHADLIACKPGSPHMFKFMASNVINLRGGDSGVFENWCFRENKVSMSWKSATQIQITVDSHNPRSTFCSDNYLITAMLDAKIESKFFHGVSTITLNLNYEADQKYVLANGVSIMPLCDKLKNLVPDILSTIWMFNDSIISFLPKWVMDSMRHVQLKKLKELTGVQSVVRKVKHRLDYDWLAATVKSGDVYCQYSESGSNTAIIFGTGGVCAHVGMFLWEGTTLYFVEANPPDVHRYEARQWLSTIQSDPDNNLSILQLSEENRKKFSEKSAWQSFFQIQGKPYGFDNILFSFWDTPDHSFTHLANTEVLMTYVAILGKIPAARPALAQFLEQGLNKRLGTSGLTFEQILGVLGDRGMTIGELGSVPEDESWAYGPDQGPRYICSAVVLRLLRDSGVLSGKNIVPQELTPNDIYNLKLWKASGIPRECTENDPYLPYCQLTGRNALLPFKYFNSIEPYDRMNERCPSIAPVYERPPGC